MRPGGEAHGEWEGGVCGADLGEKRRPPPLGGLGPAARVSVNAAPFEDVVRRRTGAIGHA